ncbi:MAG TPA: MFS transporter [Desulfitobacteriaceae bacterium]|nr:MFS transporter [Desulfitobacteriaceae bacterium]
MNPLLVLGMIEFVRGALILSLTPLFGQSVAGYSLGVIGTAISLHYLFDNLFRLPAGWVVDQMGGKAMLAGGIILSGIGLFLIYAHWSVTWFMLGAVLYGLGTAPLWPTVITGIAAKIPIAQLGEVMSKVFIAWLVGAGLGPVIINFILGYSFARAFLFLGVLLFFAFILTLAGQYGQIGNQIKQALPHYFQELRQEILGLRLLYPGMFIQTMSVGILMPIIAIYTQTVWGFRPDQFSYFLIGGGSFTVLLLIPAGRITDRWGIKGPLIGGFFLAGICLVLLPLQKSVYLALIVCVFLGISYSFILPAWNSLQARAVSPEKRGTMWAIFMTIEGIGTASGAFIGGKVTDVFGQQSPFYVSSVVLLAMALFYALGNIDKLIQPT